MKEKMTYLETSNCKYPLCFNLNVMEEIQEIYGSIKNWGELVENKDGGEPKIKDLKNGLMAMINEGIDIENEKNESKMPFVTSKQIGRIIGEVGIAEMVEKMKVITIESTKTEDDGKNE